ncbi:hypothetical protein HanHA300_Chr08g0280171 [Helianthus annuus]|nr:hypothetical protein HanHA300_Chr08g0280171 [Helianthus annuus]
MVFFLMVNPQSFVTIELEVFFNQNSRNTRRSHRLPKVMLKKVLLGIVLVTFNFQILSIYLMYVTIYLLY